METPSADDLVGRLLGGRFKIERPLKRGGMGQVYVAHDETNGSLPVAVKVVRQALLQDPQALSRFKREARLCTELHHDNIVTSLAVGEDGGLLWIAMELLAGETLRERLDQRGRMAWQETLPIVEQIVRALQVAHDKGVIHRDLKPENVMLAPRPGGGDLAKLLDFGVAKQAKVDGESASSNMTGTGFIVGTPGYVAPEVVLEGRTDDPRSDFYALGVAWFEMLTAQKPFTAKTAFALAMRHAHEPAPTPTSFVPYSPVPHPIERLVLRLMAKSPEERPQDAKSLLDQLATLADESQKALTTPMPMPPSLEAHAATMTATDMANMAKPSTGVVPFRTPLGGPGPLALTPSTAMHPGTQPGMTPQSDAAQLLPQLLALVPKKKLAGVAAAFVVFVVVAAVVTVLTVLHFAGGRELAAAARAQAQAQAAQAARDPPRPPPTPPPTRTIDVPITAALAIPDGPDVPDAHDVADVSGGEPGLNHRAHVDKVRSEPARSVAEVNRTLKREEREVAKEVAAASGTGLLTLRTTPQSKVFIDDAHDSVDSGFAERAMAVGTHRARFVVGGKQVKEKTFTITVGEVTKINLSLADPP